MKKIFLLSIINFSLLFLNAQAQAPLPTSYGFEGFASPSNLPNGWTTNIAGTFTYSTGQTGAAAKLDLQGEYIGIQTNDPMGTVAYYLKGATANGATWNGTFKVQESVNGSTWTDLASYTSLGNSSFTQYTVQPATSSRYVQFIFSNKQSGSNVALDEVSVAQAIITTQEINVKQNGSTIFSGGTSAPFASNVGTPLTVNFTIENQGTQQILNVSDVTFSGSNAGDYAATTVPSTVATSGNSTLTITFTPGGNGTRNAVMNIASNDADESTYSINLFGVGGQFATEPTEQATNMSFSGVKSFRYKVGFGYPNQMPTGFLVLRKKGSAITETPVDGTFYQRGDAIGEAKVINVGDVNNIYPNNIVAGTDYYFAVFAYNGAATVVNYLQANPLTGMVTSAANNPGTYYNGIDPNSTNFVSALQSLINPHTPIFYGNYDETILRNFESRDTTGGQKVVTCVYSGLNKVYTEPFDWGTQDFSREHTYCHDWMPTNPADNPEKPEYNDQHHLFPAKFIDVNETRSNLPLDNALTTTSTFLESTLGKNENGKNIFEPRDSHKGDAARALFYVATCYNNVSGNDWSLPNATIFQNQNVLRQWHFQDPPDAWEIARNEYLDSLQGNRNPFIDNPDWVCNIDFHSMNYIANPSAAPCEFTNVNERNLEATALNVYPNPVKDFVSVAFNASTFQDISVELQDLTGKILFAGNYTASNGMNQYPINMNGLAKGNYFVKIVTTDGVGMKKIVKE